MELTDDLKDLAERVYRARTALRYNEDREPSRLLLAPSTFGDSEAPTRMWDIPITLDPAVPVGEFRLG